MNRQMISNKNSQSGFTLTELMIVLVIVGLMAAFALPSYRDQALRSARTDAKADLATYAQELQECYSQTGNFGHNDCKNIIGSSKTSSEGKYTIAFVGTPTAEAYTLRATPISGKGQERDTDCASFTINNLGQQSALDSGNADNTDECW